MPLTATYLPTFLVSNIIAIAALVRADCKGGDCIGAIDDYQYIVL